MNRLRQIRERKSLSMAQVSARTSIPIRLLTDYEGGQAEISSAHLKALAKALWVKPDEIMPPSGADQPIAAGPTPQPQPQPPVEQHPAPQAAPAPPQPSFAPRPYQPAPGAGNYAAPPVGPRPMAAPLGPRPGGAATAFAPDAPRPASRSRTRQPVPMPATEGQVTEIMRLAARLNLSTDQLTAKFERNMADLSRFDAREWIKVLREEALTKAPPAKVHFGQWPGLKDDLEAVYLGELRNEGATLKVTLFNGQQFEGRIADFTPYTLTVQTGDSGGVVLRKLAIAYYQQTSHGDGAPAENATATEEAHDPAPFEGSGAPPFAVPSSNGSAAAPAEASHES